MASNITTTAAFTTTNMKPDPGEQADALWAQKSVDNGGHLYYREIAVPLGPDGSAPPAYYYSGSITKRASHNALRLRVFGDNSLPTAAVSDMVNIYVSGSDAVTLTSTHSYTRGQNTVSDFEVNISSLVTGTTYLIVVIMDATKTYHPPMLWQIHTLGATY